VSPDGLESNRSLPIASRGSTLPSSPPGMAMAVATLLHPKSSIANAPAVFADKGACPGQRANFRGAGRRRPSAGGPAPAAMILHRILRRPLKRSRRGEGKPMAQRAFLRLLSLSPQIEKMQIEKIMT